MAKEVQKRLQSEQIASILTQLEKEGKQKWLIRWQKHLGIPPNLNPYSSTATEREKVLRFLLFRALINQQGRMEKVRELCLKTGETFGDILLFKPFEVPEIDLFGLFKNIGGEKGAQVYRVGALGGIKPISLFAYRIKSFECFIRWLGRENYNLWEILSSYLVKEKDTKKLLEFLVGHPCLEAGWEGPKSL